MAKATYGFPTGTDKEDAKASAVARAMQDGIIGPKGYKLEVLETDAHKANNEFVVVIRGLEDLQIG